MPGKVYQVMKITHRWELLFLVCLFAAAFAIRSIGIGWGLPGQNYSYSVFLADEPGVLYSSLVLGQGYYRHELQNYPFFYYLSFFVFGFYFFAGLVAGHFQGLSDFKAQYILDRGQFLIMGRIFIIFVASLTVVLTYELAKRLFGRTVAIISSLFMLLSFGHIVYSKVFRLDSFLPFIYLCVFYLIVRLAQSNTRRLWPYVLAGFALAFAVATKVTGWAILIPYLLLPFVGTDGRWSLRPRIDRRYVFSIYIAVCTYIVMVAPVLNEVPSEVSSAVGRLSKETTYIGNPANLSPYRYSIVWHLTKTLPAQMGSTIYPFAILGLPLLVFDRRHRLAAVFILAALVSYLGPIGYAIRTAWRDVLPILPLLSVVAAYGLLRASELIAPRLHDSVGRDKLALAVTAVVLLMPVANIYRQKQLILQPDTRDIATSWIEEHVPAGSHIAVETYGPSIMDSSYRENVVDYVNENGSTDGRVILPGPTYAVTALNAKRLETKGSADPQTVYEFITENNTDYLILSSGSYARYYNDATESLHPEMAAEAQAYYDLVASNLEPVETFVPDWQSRPGPVIQIFRVPPDFGQRGLAPAISGKFDPFPGMERPATAVGYYQFSPR